ncbi:MAG: 9-O-acetylesterase, partial [Spirochaetia bacterium]|nr:9-O-acetylesterase [Spirochaetia bacterium]
MNPRSTLRKEVLENYLKKTEAWIDDARKSISSETSSPPMPGFPPELLPPQNQQAPSVLYNAMIYGIVPFSMRGALWYQGEANVSEGKLYTEKMKGLIGGWRKLWNDNFPFYFVQIAPYHYGSQAPNVLPEFWEAMDMTTRVVSNTGMVVIHDVGDLKDIHPKNKQEVGKRLALQAMANTYGRKNLVFSGPAFKSMAVEGESAKLSFDHVGSGLASRDGKALSLFEIIDASEGGWVNADAAIQGATVVLSSPKVKKPLGVRFAWNKLAEPNFMNKEGLPGVPFRAGDISSRDALSMNVDEVRDYQLALELDLSKIGGETINYQIDNRAKLARPFDRIAYYLELKDAGGAVQWVYVSMDAFTDDLSKIGVPTLDSKAKFQQLLTGLTIFSGVPGIVQGAGLKGNIEFWPNNYASANAKNIPNASANAN